MARRHWLLVSNPTKVWDVWKWWLDGNRDFEGWTISKHFGDISAGDDVALWISGKAAGVYAVGRATSGAEPYSPKSDAYWISPPDPKKTRYVYTDISRYLFDRPLLRRDLAKDPAFKNALIIRVPNGGNPSPLTDREWAVVAKHTRRAVATTRDTGAQVLQRPLGDETEDITVPVRERMEARQFREARLVKDYERWLGRPLVHHIMSLPSGEHLVADAFDPKTGTLIEAKADSTRQSIRMAIGQLLDYSRHVPEPPRKKVILVPERPTADLIDLARSLKIRVTHRSKGGFTTVRG